MLSDFLLALQAAASPAAAAPAAAAIDFDLGRLQRLEHGLADPRRGCGRPTGDEILVCGVRERGGDYPLGEMARRFEPRPVVAETGIVGTLTARIHMESATLANGMVSNRVMVGVRLPF